MITSTDSIWKHVPAEFHKTVVLSLLLLSLSLLLSLLCSKLCLLQLLLLACLLYFCTVFARICRLRKSQQYLLVILRWKMTISANLRNSPQTFHKKSAETYIHIYTHTYREREKDVQSEREREIERERDIVIDG